MTKPKILVIDIEWRPTKAYVWQPWQENIHADKIIEHGGLLCFGYKWVGGKAEVLSDWEHGHEQMVHRAHELLSEADAVVTYNGDKYDIPKLRGEFLLVGLKDIPPVTSIDLIKTVRKLGYFQNGLGFIGPFLGLGRKLDHEGMRLWVKVNEGNEQAQKKMSRYCKQDVNITEKLYLKVRPFIKEHPNMGFQPAGSCGACGSERVQKRGPRRTKHFHVQRLQCQDCGSWFSGARKKVV
jgi:hypothetical protein